MLRTNAQCLAGVSTEIYDTSLLWKSSNHCSSLEEACNILPKDDPPTVFASVVNCFKRKFLKNPQLDCIWCKHIDRMSSALSYHTLK